jgi:hypothetical protein
MAATYLFSSIAFFQSSVIRSRVDWQPNPDLKAAKKGWKISSK